MKKLILILLLPLLLSCSVDGYVSCNCGLVISNRVRDYSVVIRNECTGDDKLFYLYPNDWRNAQVGSQFCIYNTNTWRISKNK